MKKKILIGSIIAVVITVLVLFTSVVGFETTKSNSIRLSPLFYARSKRVINGEEIELDIRYINKGEECIIPLGNRPNNTHWNRYTLPKWTTAACTVMDPIWTCAGTGLICYITTGPICGITNGPICEFITTGFVCYWFAFGPYGEYE